jgi:hypothetical protein
VRPQPDHAERGHQHDRERAAPGEARLVEHDREERAQVEHGGDQPAARAAPRLRPRLGDHREPERPLAARADAGQETQREEQAQIVHERHAARAERIQHHAQAERAHAPHAIAQLREEHAAHGAAQEPDPDGRPDLLEIDAERVGDLLLEEDEEHDVGGAEQEAEAGGEQGRDGGGTFHGSISTPGFMIPAGSRDFLKAASACP